MNLPTIEDAIKAYAKAKRVKPDKFAEFRETILAGMRTIGLNTEHIEVDKFMAIARKQKPEPTIGEKLNMIGL